MFLQVKSSDVCQRTKRKMSVSIKHLKPSFKSLLISIIQDDWDELLNNILFEYRSSRHDSTKCTPFLLMYGREAQLPIDLTPHIGSIGSDSQPEQELDLATKGQQILDLQKNLQKSNLWWHVTDVKNGSIRNIYPNRPGL